MINIKVGLGACKLCVCLHLLSNQTHLHTRWFCVTFWVKCSAVLGFDGLLGDNLSRRLTVLGSGYKGRPHKGENSGSKTHPCDNWYQSFVVSSLV